MKKSHKIAVLFSVVFFIFLVPVLYAGVYINLVVVNAVPDQTKETPVKYYLPKELDPEDIINTGELTVDYDVQKSVYFVTGSVKLGPKESKVIKIEVKDVWRITEDEVNILKNQINNNLNQLKNTPYYESGKILQEDMERKLDYILAQQVNYSDNIERRIEEYRSYADAIESIRKNAFSIDFLKFPGNVAAETRSVKLVIEVQNPSKTETKTVKQPYYMPKEVKAEDIIEKQGFEVRFDEEKQQAYLLKEEIFKPGETKRYEITIKDIWKISQDSIDAFRVRTEKAFEGVKKTEYEESANYLMEHILDRLQKIEQSQKGKQDMQKHIGTFRLNRERYIKAEDDLLRLEKMLAAAKAKKLEELESSKVKNVLQKLQALRGITQLSQAIFGKKPSITTTWKVIWGILAFIAFFTTVHFFTWWKRSQTFGEELGAKAGGIKEIKKTVENPDEEKK